MTDASRALFGLGTECVAVLRAELALVVGVFDRVTGVFTRVIGVLCCLDALPPSAMRLDPVGELDRVEAGLAGLEFELSFLIEIGNREGEDG